jgi:MFS family permease
MARFRHVLKNKNFFRLWIGQIVSQFGDRLNQMALIALVYQKSPGSTVQLAKLILFIIIPVFIIGPVAGAYVDRWNRKRIMVVSDVLRGVLVLGIPLCIIYVRTTIPIYVLVFLIFSITRFFLPSKMAVIPSIVPREQLLIANTLSDTTRMIATVIGLGVAGLMVRWAGVIASFYIDALTFFISALLLSTIRLKEEGLPLKEDFRLAEEALKSALKTSILRDIKRGFEYFVTQKSIRFVGSIYLVLMSGLGALFCVAIVFIQNLFGSVTRDLGFLGMFLGIGLFVGTVLYGRLGQRYAKTTAIFGNLAISGIGLVLFTVSVQQFRSFALAATISFVVGMFIGPIIVSSNTLVHEVLPEDARGKVFSSLEVIIHVGFLVCMVAASYLADLVGSMWVLVLVGSVFTLLGIGGIVAKKRLATA